MFYLFPSLEVFFYTCTYVLMTREINGSDVFSVGLLFLRSSSGETNNAAGRWFREAVHEMKTCLSFILGNACVHQVEFWLVLFLTSPVSTSDFYRRRRRAVRSRCSSGAPLVHSGGVPRSPLCSLQTESLTHLFYCCKPQIFLSWPFHIVWSGMWVQPFDWTQK